MPEHKIGTREEWRAARDELAKIEAEHAELGQKVAEQRRQLPWVPVQKEYQFDAEDGKKTLAELSTGVCSSSPTTSCSGRITKSAPAPGARTWRMSSTPPVCI
jgi:hypothetical protein